MTTNRTQPKTTTCVFDCHASGDTRLRQALLSASKDARIKDVIVDTTKKEYGFKKGSHLLTVVLAEIAGNVEPIADTEQSGTVLGDEHCSSLEILSNAAAILHQMAGTPWLAIKKFKVESTKKSPLQTGWYDSQDFLKELANMVDESFTARMKDNNIDFRNTVTV